MTPAQARPPMRAVPVGGQYGQLTAQPPKQRTRAAGSVPLLKEMPHISNISSVSNRCWSSRFCTRCHDVGIADFPATATLLVSVRPCIITSKVKQQVMGSMDQRVPWNQFIREAKVGHSGSPTCDCCGIRRWTCYKKCTSASALSPQLLLVRRESAGVQECAGVILWTSLCRRNVSTFV